MKLHELEKEINEYKRLRMSSWGRHVYVIKSLINDKPLVECDFASMEMKSYTPTVEELLSDEWEFWQ